MPFCWFCHEVAHFCIALWAFESYEELFRPTCRDRLYILGLGISKHACLSSEFTSPGWIANLGSVLHLPFESCHEIMALFVFRKLILQTRMRSRPVGGRCLIFFRLLPCCANSEGSGRLCDKYHNLMSWLILGFVSTDCYRWNAMHILMNFQLPMKQ